MFIVCVLVFWLCDAESDRFTEGYFEKVLAQETDDDKVLFKKPSSFAKPIAQIKSGRMLIIENCENIWCKVTAEEFKGWVKINNLWGLN